MTDTPLDPRVLEAIASRAAEIAVELVLERLAGQTAQARAQRWQQRETRLYAAARAYVRENPTASPNAIANAIGGRRQDALRAAQKARAAQESERLAATAGAPPTAFRLAGNARPDVYVGPLEWAERLAAEGRTKEREE